MNAPAIYAHSDHGTQAAADAIAGTLPGAVVKYHKRRDRWDVLTPASDDGCKVISFEALPKLTPEELAAEMRMTAEEQSDAKDRWEHRCKAYYESHYRAEAERIAKAVLTEGPAGVQGDPKAFDSFPILDADDFADAADDSPNDQVQGIIPSVGVGQMIGASGAGKSFVALDICAHIALGKEYHGRKVNKGRALYICAEGARGFKKRLRAWKQHHGVESFDDGLKLLTVAANLFKPVQIGALIARVKVEMQSATCVVFDTRWRNAQGSEENSASDQATIFGSADALARRLNAFTLLIAHTGHGDQTRARGSSAQYAACDTELTVERRDDVCIVKISKAKDQEGGEELAFKSRVIDLGENAHGEHESSLVLVPVAPSEMPKSSKQQRPKGARENVVYDSLKTLAPFGTVHVEDLIAAYRNEIPKGEGKDRRGADAKRALENLIAKKLVHMHGEFQVSLSPLVHTKKFTDAEPF